MARQEEMLARALVALMDHLEDASWLTTALPARGAKHATYGVTDPRYGYVGECLLAALVEAAGADWTAELAAAWAAAYTTVSGLMMDALVPAAPRRTSGQHAAVSVSQE